MTIDRITLLSTMSNCSNNELFVLFNKGNSIILFHYQAVSALPCPPYCEEEFVCINYNALVVETYIRTLNSDPDAEINNNYDLLFKDAAGNNYTIYSKNVIAVKKIL